jgi:hypothetical protein
MQKFSTFFTACNDSVLGIWAGLEESASPQYVVF